MLSPVIKRAIRSLVRNKVNTLHVSATDREVEFITERLLAKLQFEGSPLSLTLGETEYFHEVAHSQHKANRDLFARYRF